MIMVISKLLNQILDSENKIKVFENKNVCTVWNDEEEDWYFSVVDICWILVDSPDYTTASKNWNKLKQHLKSEENELVKKCLKLKLQAADGKMREADILNTKGVLHLVQSIPSNPSNISPANPNSRSPNRTSVILSKSS